jgi:hypothetical protein
MTVEKLKYLISKILVVELDQIGFNLLDLNKQNAEQDLWVTIASNDHTAKVFKISIEEIRNLEIMY